MGHSVLERQSPLETRMQQDIDRYLTRPRGDTP